MSIFVKERLAVKARRLAERRDVKVQRALSLALAGRASSRLRRTTALIVAGFAVAALLLSRLAAVPMPGVPGVMTVLTAGIMVCELCTTLLLLLQYRESRARFLLPLSGGALFTATMMVPQLLAFPGALVPDLAFLGNGQTAGWTWLFWHIGFAAAALVSILQEIRAPGLVVPAAMRWRAWQVCGAALASGGVLAAVSVVWSNLLPPLIVGRIWTGWNNGLVGAALLLTAVGAALVWRVPRLRNNALLLWLSVALAASLFDIGMSLLGGARYSLGWYIGRISAFAASTMLLGLLLHQFSEAYRAIALSLRRAVAQRETMGEAAQRSDAMLRTILETAPGVIYAKDRQGRMLLANAAALELIGKPWAEVQGRTDAQVLDDPSQAAPVMVNDARIMERNQTEQIEEVVGTEGSQQRIWFSTKAPLRDAGGVVIGLVGVSVDITELKRIEHRLRLMVDELNHRVKNTLATVQAIASQSLRGADPQIRLGLDGRLMALASAHDVLTREKWEGAELTDLVIGALAAFSDVQAERFQISGPAVRLRPGAGLAIVMALHELATNATKYGALSCREGRVTILWEIAGGADPHLRMSWTERHGPLVVPPTRRGFGTKLIERSLASDLQGATELRLDDPAGAVCRIDTALSEVAASAELLPFPRVGRLA